MIFLRTKHTTVLFTKPENVEARWVQLATPPTSWWQWTFPLTVPSPIGSNGEWRFYVSSEINPRRLSSLLVYLSLPGYFLSSLFENAPFSSDFMLMNVWLVPFLIGLHAPQDAWSFYFRHSSVPFTSLAFESYPFSLPSKSALFHLMLLISIRPFLNLQSIKERKLCVYFEWVQWLTDLFYLQIRSKGFWWNSDGVIYHLEANDIFRIQIVNHSDSFYDKMILESIILIVKQSVTSSLRLFWVGKSKSPLLASFIGLILSFKE